MTPLPGRVLLGRTSTLPDAFSLVIDVDSNFTFPDSDVRQAIPKRLRLVPHRFYRPLAIFADIAKFPGGLPRLRRHQRQPIRQRLGEHNLFRKARDRRTRFVDE